MQFVSRSLRATNILLRDTKYCAWKLLCSANPFVRKTFENLILNLIIAKIGKETNWRNEFLIWISCKHQSSFKAHKVHLRYIIWHTICEKSYDAHVFSWTRRTKNRVTNFPIFSVLKVKHLPLKIRSEMSTIKLTKCILWLMLLLDRIVNALDMLP